MATEQDRRITNRRALRVIGRAMRYSLAYKYELAVKMTTQMTSTFWLAVLPFPAKIVIDYVVLPDGAKGETENAPFFLDPLLRIVEPLTPYETAWLMGALFIVMILLVGAFGTEGPQRDGAVTELAEGEDSATRSENQANNMHSLVSGLFGLFEALWHIRITHRLNHRLRSELFRHFGAHRITDFDDRAIGDVVYRGMYDTPSISNIVFNLWVGPATASLNIVIPILLMLVMFRSEPVVIWCALAIAPLCFFAILYFANLIRRQGLRAREAGAATTAVIEEGLSNVLAVQGLGNDRTDHARFAAASALSFRRFRGVVLAGVLSGYTTTVIGVGAIFVVFYFMSPAFIEGRYAPGDWFVIWTYFGTIGATAGYLGRLWFSLQENVTGLERVFDILDAPVEAVADVGGRGVLAPDYRIREGIRLDAVDYDYPDGTPALRGVDFEGRLGEMVALAGPTGAGKTTLAYLVPGLLTPTAGRYYVDGRVLTEFDLAPLRRQVAFVFQETSVFNDTIETNIRMGRAGAAMADVRRAAALAGAAEFIEALPEGYAIDLGRAGAKLSVGQKQRIAIARALLSNKPILVLDEPTASLDPQTENRLVANLREAREGRLVIVIAHRLSTIRSADRIYFLEEGRVVESGTHDVLVASGGTYARFVQLQDVSDREDSP